MKILFIGNKNIINKINTKYKIFTLNNFDQKEIYDLLIIDDNKLDDEYLNIFKCKFLLLNNDNKIDFKKYINSVEKIITYGINGKSTITVSSINQEENYYQICIQRYFESLKKNKLYQKEYLIKSNEDLYETLIQFCINTILD